MLWRIQRRGPGGPPSLFLDQTEARRAEKKKVGPPPTPLPLSEGLDLATVMGYVTLLLKRVFASIDVQKKVQFCYFRL